jgi:HK97 family phage prohead protease
MEYKILEFKTDTQKEGVFRGYASVFDEIDVYNDRIVRGAFRKSLGQFMPKMLWQHDQDQVIGVWSKLSEDQKGLCVEGRLLLEVEKAREAYALLKEGALDGLSIGYQVKQALKGQRRDATRLLTEVDLFEISLVTFPANALARISFVKSS